MNTPEIAAASAVPDHDRFLVFGKLEKMAGQLSSLPPVPEGIGRFNRTAVEFADSDHSPAYTPVSPYVFYHGPVL